MAVETAKKQGSIKPRRMKAPKPFKKRIEPWLWLMPALVFFLVFTYYPFIKTVVSSFFVVNKMGVFKQFAGFDTMYASSKTAPSRRRFRTRSSTFCSLRP